MTSAPAAGMKPLLVAAAAGHGLLVLFALGVSGGVRDGVQQRILKNPVAFGAREAAVALREQYPSAPETQRESMLVALRTVTRQESLFANTPPDHPLKVQVLQLIREAARPPYSAAEEEALFDLLCVAAPEERLLYRVVPGSSRQALLRRCLGEHEARLRQGKAAPADSRPPMAEAPGFRTTLLARDIPGLLDPAQPPSAELCRELFLGVGFQPLPDLKGFRDWIEAQLVKTELGALQRAAGDLLTILKRDGLYIEATAKAQQQQELKTLLLPLLSRAPEQMDGLLRLLLPPEGKRSPDDMLLVSLLGQLQGEARLKLFRSIVADALERRWGFRGRAELTRRVLALGEELSPPLYETLLRATLEYIGDQEPYESIFTYTLAHPVVQETFLKLMEAAGPRAKLRLEGSLRTAPAPGNAASLAFLQTQALRALDAQRQGPMVRDLLKRLDLSEDSVRARVADLMFENKVNRFQPSPRELFRIARPADVSNLYARLIGRLLESKELPPSRYLEAQGEIRHVTEGADLEFIRSRLKQTHPELVGKFPALKKAGAP